MDARLPTLYYTESEGPNIPALQRAVGKLLELARESEHHQGVIATHSRHNLDGILSKVLGEKLIKQLSKGKIRFKDVEILLMTERIKPVEFIAGPILAPHVSHQLLEHIKWLPSATAVIYVPWAPKEHAIFVYDNEHSIPI